MTSCGHGDDPDAATADMALELLGHETGRRELLTVGFPDGCGFADDVYLKNAGLGSPFQEAPTDPVASVERLRNREKGGVNGQNKESR